VRYVRKHPETQLTVLEIPQVPGYRRQVGANKSVVESLITTGYVIPPCLHQPVHRRGVFVDYLAWGRYRLTFAHPQILTPEKVLPLTFPAGSGLSLHDSSIRFSPPLERSLQVAGRGNAGSGQIVADDP
jgi:hypothetical protein